MLNSVVLLNPLFTPHSNQFFVPMRCVHQFGVKLFVSITHSVCTMCLLTFLTPQCFEGSNSSYLGWLHAVLHDFNELPPPTNVEKELENCNSFFMTLGLYILLKEYVDTCIQILILPINPNMTSTSSAFLRISQKM